MIFVNNENVIVAGQMWELLADITSAMVGVRDALGGDYTKEELDEFLHVAVDVSSKSSEQLLEDIEKLDEMKKEL